jgi:3-deoxy-D-manno-octulosonic-acid transferase
MDDFGEISRGLLLAGGALMVHSKGDLQERLRELLNDAALRRQIGDKGKKLIAEQQGVTSRHLEVIRQILDKGEAA